MITRVLLFFIALNFIHQVQAQSTLRNDILDLTRSVDGRIGVGIRHINTGDTITINGSDHFPMQSVYKFHLSLAVLDQVDKGKLSLNQKIRISKSDYFPGTWSPIAKKYPEGNVELSIRELLSYTVSQSDNNGCDILFRLVGGPKKVNDYIHGLGIRDVAILNTEAEMHRDETLQYKNSTTPNEMISLLTLFSQNNILSSTAQEELLAMLKQTPTGPKRIKGLLPPGTIVAHKTGTGSRENDVLSAINDVGVMTLPNGQHIAIAFFISGARNDDTTLETVMAKISKLVYDRFK
jgi:beta-lactamase class A